MRMYLAPSYQRRRQRNRSQRTPRSDACEVRVPMDVREEGDAFVLELIVPGLTPEDLDIEIVEDVVDIQGEFEKEDRDEGVEYLRQERPTGTFRRRVKLPALLDVNAAEAHLEQGLLTLRVPKAEEALPRTVKVKAK